MPTTYSTSRHFTAGLKVALLHGRAYVALVVVMISFALLSPAFLTTGNLIILTKQVAINAILGIGMTFVILSGGIDLSVGSIVGLSGMVAGWLITEGLVLPMFGVSVFFNVWIVMLLAVLSGVVVGLVNGLLVTRLGVAPFIATLGTLYVARGAALLISGGSTFGNLQGVESLGNTGFPVLGAESLFGLPYPIWMMVAMAGVAAFVAWKTPFGRQVYAVGGNEKAAELSGVAVGRIKLATYVISGACAAVVGLIIASQLVAAHPATGETFELNAIAVVVLGGTSLMGGRGTIAGTIIGAFVIGVLVNGMVLLGVSEFWQIVIKGTVIVLAVIVDQWQLRAQKKAIA
jgi:erythritol transport system permease protein